MAKTIQERWDRLQEAITERKRMHLTAFLATHKRPFFICYCNRNGTVDEFAIEDIRIAYKGIFEPRFNKKPTNKDCDALVEYYHSMDTAEKRFLLCYSTRIGSTSKEYSEIDGVNWAFTPEELEEKAKLNKELYAPRDGYSPCKYCGKQTPSEKLIESTIIGRGRKEVYNSWKGRYESKACVTQERLKFCSGTCAGHEQMSREG